MNNIHNIDEHSKFKQSDLVNDEKRLNEASDWIAKLDRNLTLDEKKSLQIWLSLAPENTIVLFEVAQLWDKMDELSRLSDLFPKITEAKKQTPKWLGAVAASVVFTVLFSFYQNNFITPFSVQEKQSPVVAMQMSYQTDIGESNTINLPDNSIMVLNTNSFVQVKYTQHARIIELQRGEIHIDVAHDISRPLSVITGEKVIQAVGTAFNVEIHDEQVELIVTEGKVLVAHKNPIYNHVDIEKMAHKLPNNSMAISKGEKVELNVTGKVQEEVIKLNEIEIAANLSWRQGNLIFRGESLVDAMAEISRYTNIAFELADDQKLKQVKVAGLFKTGDVTGLLDVLTRNFNISYEKVTEDKILLRYAG